MEITEKQFWINFWNSLSLPVEINDKIKNESAIKKKILDLIPKGNFDKKALEIGCAPGKWLALIHKELKYIIEGIEYVDVAAEKTRENLKLLQIPEKFFVIYNIDFLQSNLNKKYDFVFSLGFLEHFENYEDILVKHLELLENGGYLVIGVPNFKGINKIFHNYIDKFAKEKYLKNHILATMEKNVYKKFAENHSLSIIFNNFIGGFEPNMFRVEEIPNKYMRIGITSLIHILSKIFSKLNTKFTSSYLLVVLKK